MIATVVYVVAGLWLLSVPFVFEHGVPAAMSDRVVGLLFVIVGLMATRYPRVILAGLLVGAYLIVMPFLLGYEGSSHQVHDIAIGATAVVTALVASRRRVAGFSRLTPSR